MKKTLIATITALSFSALADESVRMVISHKDGTKEVVTSDEFAQRSFNSNGVAEKDVLVGSPDVKPTNYSYDNTSVLTQLSKKSIATVYSSGTAANTNYVPNDPYFDEQVHWLPANSSYQAYNNILPSVQTLSPLRRPVIGVVDSGFYQHPDLIYRDGYNFSTINDGVVGEYFYIPEEYNSTPQDRVRKCSVHGTGVAAVAVATRDNNIGFAGISDADFIAARSMHCGFGLLNESADAIMWQAGKPMDGIRPASVVADVINVSLGGNADSCPTFMQDAIDVASEAGIPVVVAIGNKQIDASGFTPINCKGGINVAAATREGDLFPSSNYGKEIDIVALGDYVASATEYPDGIGWWEESSFAAPIVTGVIANATSELGKLTNAEIKFFLSVTATPFIAGQCDDSIRCGAGILDATSFQNGLRDYKEGSVVTIKPALANTEICDKALFATNDDELARLCETFELVLPKHQSNRDDIRFEVLAFDKGEDMSHENGELVATSTSSRMLLNSLDMDINDYGVRMCNSERCFGDTALKVTNNSGDIPAICTE